MHLRFKIAGLFASFGLFPLLGMLLAFERQMLRPLLDGLVIAVLALALILVPQVRQVSGWFVMGGSVLLWGLYKLLIIDTLFPVSMAPYSMILLETVLVVMVVGLAYNISSELQALQKGDGVLRLAVDLLPELESEIGREIVKKQITRCRQSERPLSILLFNPFPIPAAPGNGLLSEIPVGLQAAYQKSRMAEWLRRQLSYPETVLLEAAEERFLVLCPEATACEARQLANTLKQKAVDEFGVHLIWAAATFPDDGLTFNKLMQVAAGSLEVEPNGNGGEYASEHTQALSGKPVSGPGTPPS